MGGRGTVRRVAKERGEGSRVPSREGRGEGRMRASLDTPEVRSAVRKIVAGRWT